MKNHIGKILCNYALATNQRGLFQEQFPKAMLTLQGSQVRRLSSIVNVVPDRPSDWPSFAQGTDDVPNGCLHDWSLWVLRHS